jgi:chromosome segregation ATPase
MATKKKIPKKTAIKAHTKPTTKTIKKAQPKKAITTRKTARNLTAKHKSLQEEFETLKAQATRTEKNAVHTQLATLASERDQLKKSAGDHHNALAAAKQELEALKAQAAEAEKKRTELSGQLDARTKERDSIASEKNVLNAQLATLASERDAFAAERDQLKKTVADRSSRIAELEAQTADQAERQIQIDEQMVRAEAQLEMLKDFMRPSFD